MNELTVNLNTHFDDFELSINEKIPMSGITGIFGHSGSGKSTLLRCISGLEKRTSGKITLDGTELYNSKRGYSVKPEKRKIGLIFQDVRLFPHLNVLDNLKYSYKRRSNNTLNIEDILTLTQLETLKHKKISQLSGGEKQRTAIARAILAEPTLLLLDEPLSALDNTSKSLMLALILNVQRTLNIPMLYVSHSMSELQQIADNLLVMKQGKVTHFGNIHQTIHTLNNSQTITPQTSLALLVNQHLPKYGLTSLALAPNINLYLPLYTSVLPESSSKLDQEQQLQKIRCFIAASDISVSRHEAKESSIVNHFQAKITNIESLDNTVLISLNCHEHTFYSSISLWSAERLALSINDLIYIQFKASAVHSLTDIGVL